MNIDETDQLRLYAAGLRPRILADDRVEWLEPDQAPGPCPRCGRLIESDDSVPGCPFCGAPLGER